MGAGDCWWLLVVSKPQDSNSEVTEKVGADLVHGCSSRIVSRLDLQLEKLEDAELPVGKEPLCFHLVVEYWYDMVGRRAEAAVAH